MNRLITLIFGGLIFWMLGGEISTASYQPNIRPSLTIYEYRWVRITAYSPKQPREGYKNHKGKIVKNERGIAVPKGFLTDGTRVILPNGEIRIVDDRIPLKSSKKFNHQTVDVRYYYSIKSKSKTRAVNRELRKKFDLGYGYIRIERYVNKP